MGRKVWWIIIGDVLTHWRRCVGSLGEKYGGALLALSFGGGWLIVGDVVWWRCGGSLAAHQTSAAWNPASPTMFRGRCKVVVQYCRCLPFCKWE